MDKRDFEITFLGSSTITGDDKSEPTAEVDRHIFDVYSQTVVTSK